jgi:hypothetical protein
MPFHDRTDNQYRTPSGKWLVNEQISMLKIWSTPKGGRRRTGLDRRNFLVGLGQLF